MHSLPILCNKQRLLFNADDKKHLLLKTIKKVDCQTSVETKLDTKYPRNREQEVWTIIKFTKYLTGANVT